MKVSSGLTQDRRAWSASVRDVVNSIGEVGSTRPLPLNRIKCQSKVTLFITNGNIKAWGTLLTTRHSEPPVEMGWEKLSSELTQERSASAASISTCNVASVTA